MIYFNASLPHILFFEVHRELGHEIKKRIRYHLFCFFLKIVTDDLS